MFYRCIGGGSGELHGANIIVDIEETELIGKDCVLTLNDKVVDVQVVTSAMSVLFSEIQEVGTYTITAIGDKSYSVTTNITAADIVNKNTITLVISSRIYFYRYGDECIDLTGGWQVDGSYGYVMPTKFDDHLYFKTTFGQNVFGMWRTTNQKMALQGKTLVGVDMEILSIDKSKSSNFAARFARVAPQIISYDTLPRQIIKLDMSGNTTRWFEFLCNGTVEANVYQAWIE